MPITRLFPTATDVSGSLWNTFGASPAHVGLSDGSDSTGVQQQLSTFEPVRVVRGTALTALPAQSGFLKQVTIGVRGALDFNGACNLTARIGGQTLAVTPLSNVMTTYTLALAPPAGGFAAIAAADWQVQADFLSHDGVVATVTELYFDVEWYPTAGFRASIFHWLGPLLGGALLRLFGAA